MSKKISSALLIIGLFIFSVLLYTKFEAVNLSDLYEETLIDDYSVYGESLNISVNNSFENDFYFINFSTSENTEISTTENIDCGINPTDLTEGTYIILDENDNILKSEEAIDIEYYTITRNSINYKITLQTDIDGYLVYTKTKSTLPADQYDIIIDAGHGGDDSGSISIDGYTYEKDLNLLISNMLYKLLTNFGYKVALTRDADVNPGLCEGYDPYCEGGRVDLVYSTHAKLVISIHHNSGGGSGFEVYDSSFSSHKLAQSIANSLSSSFTASTKETGLINVGLYNYINEENLDYYYIIRETGGVATKGNTEENASNNTSKIGAQTVLIELGYLDDYSQLLMLTDLANQEEFSNLIAKSIDDYLQL